MFAEDRSVSEVLQDILRNLQDLVGSEVRLTKTAKSSAILTAAGAVTALFALLFMLCMIVYAQALVMPSGAATFIVGTVMAVVAAFLLRAGVQRFKQIQPVPERTVETLKENVEWPKQQAK